jgi:hypothetical protein
LEQETWRYINRKEGRKGGRKERAPHARQRRTPDASRVNNEAKRKKADRMGLTTFPLVKNGFLSYLSRLLFKVDLPPVRVEAVAEGVEGDDHV